MLFLVVFLYFFPSLRSIFTEYSISPKNEREPDSAVQRELESHQQVEERLKAELERHKEALRKSEEARKRAEAERQPEAQRTQNVSYTSASRKHNFGKFTIDVAEGWTAENQEGTVIITKNDKSAQFTVAIDNADGMTKALLAEAFVEEFKESGVYSYITTPEADKDGDFSWDMKTKAGAESHAMLTVAEGKFILMVLTNVQNAPDDFTAMLDSIKQK